MEWTVPDWTDIFLAITISAPVKKLPSYSPALRVKGHIYIVIHFNKCVITLGPLYAIGTLLTGGKKEDGRGCELF